MARSCDVCGKGPALGNQVTIRGKAKYLGGVGTKVTGISRRQFKPNLQRVRATSKNGTNQTLLVCTQCLRSGAITKRIENAPFRLPTDAIAKTKTADAKAQPKAKTKAKAPAAAPKAAAKPAATKPTAAKPAAGKPKK